MQWLVYGVREWFEHRGGWRGRSGQWGWLQTQGDTSRGTKEVTSKVAQAECILSLQGFCALAEK